MNKILFFVIVFIFYFGSTFCQHQNEFLKKVNLLYQQGKSKEAQNIIQTNLEKYKKVYGEESSIYLSIIEELADLFYEKNDFIHAEINYIEALRLYDFQKRTNQLKDYSRLHHNLALIFEFRGDYLQAELYFNKALDFIKNLNQTECLIQNIVISNNLSFLYSQIGEYSKAEQLLTQAITIAEKYKINDYENVSTSYRMLGVIYKAMNLYDKSEIYLLKSLQIIEQQKPAIGDNYYQSLNSLALLYLKIDKVAKAEGLMYQILAILEKENKKIHRDYASALDNLSEINIRKGDIKHAEKFCFQALEIRKKLFGETVSEFAISLARLASIALHKKDTISAQNIYLKALNIFDKNLGENNGYSISILLNLTEINDQQIDKTNTSKYFTELLLRTKKKWLTNLTFLNKSELQSFIENNTYELDKFYSFLTRNTNQRLNSVLSEFNLLLKNSQLNHALLLENIATKSQDTIVIDDFLRYKKYRLQLSNDLQKNISLKNGIKDLQQQIDILEKKLMGELPEFRKKIYNDQVSFNRIRNSLQSFDAAIDFVNFQYFNKDWSDTKIYAAFIIRPEWEHPYFINLFNEDQLVSLFDSSNTSYAINSLYCGKIGFSDSNCNKNLYNLIWQPIDSLLKGVKKIYISPSGILNRVSFSAIPIPEGGRLIDRYSIEQLSNIRTIAENITQEVSINSMTLFGGADFNVEPSFSDRLNVNYISTDTLFSKIRSLHRGKWSYLEGTENEVNTIKNIAKSNNISINMLTGSHASEEAFKKIGSKNSTVPSVIHIATHGFAFSTPRKISKPEKLLLHDDRANVFSASEDPLTRAGLVMAGGNHVWTTGVPYPNHDDGILTAREISELNLKNCILATLSACETGLGEIKGSEGVFGLQRAFKLAGVKYLIVSLWKVPDVQTNEFMQLFYSSWLIKNLPIRDAFRQTQIIMSKKYSPYYWGAFILIE